MYRSARFKLTFIYSTIFLLIFAALSLGVYFWFAGSLGEGYVTEVKRRHTSFPSTNLFENENREVVTISANVALEQFENILLISNGILLLLIPVFSWYLTDRTLRPIEEANERQRLFVANASHELKNPLVIIDGEMEIALKRKRTGSQYRDILQSVKEEVKSMTTLINNLLFLAREDNVKDRFNFKPVDITDILSQVIVKFARNLKEKNILLKFQPPKHSTSVFGEESMLFTLFSNIVDNSIKYTKPHRKIWVKVTNNKKYVHVYVKDSGIGISEKDLSKIFYRFYRVEDSRSEVKGFGLGLSIVEQIVKSHKGKVKVRSKLGHGTTFLVSLPKAL